MAEEKGQLDFTIVPDDATEQPRGGAPLPALQYLRRTPITTPWMRRRSWST